MVWKQKHSDDKRFLQKKMVDTFKKKKAIIEAIEKIEDSWNVVFFDYF